MMGAVRNHPCRWRDVPAAGEQPGLVGEKPALYYGGVSIPAAKEEPPLDAAFAPLEAGLLRSTATIGTSA